MKQLRNFQTGRSLIELMIALTIGLVMSGAVVGIFMSSQTTSVQTSDKTKLTQDGAYALYVLGQAIRQAGYGEIVSTVRVGDAARNLSLQAIHGCDGGYSFTGSTGTLVPSLDVTACSSSAVSTDSDAITLSQTVDPVNCPSQTPVLGAMPFDANAYWGANLLGQCVQAVLDGRGKPTSQVSHRLMIAIPPATTTTPNPVPALYLRTANIVNWAPGGGGGVTSTATAQPLIDNIEQMRLRYLVSTNNNNEGNQYMTANQVTAGNLWRQVVGVNVCLLISTNSKGTSVNATTNNGYIDCDNVSRPGVDTRMREVFKGYFGLRNRMTPMSHAGA